MPSISSAPLLNPKVPLLDEPSEGLAPIIVQDVFNVVVAMRKEGMSVVLVEQNVRAAVEIADRAFVLDNGRSSTRGRLPSSPGTRSGCGRWPAPAPRSGKRSTRFGFSPTQPMIWR